MNRGTLVGHVVAGGALLSIAACAAGPGRGAEEAARALFADYWEFRLREDPLLATGAGEARYDDRLPSVALADIGRRVEEQRAMLQQLRAIHRAALNTADAVSYDMLARELELAIEKFERGGHLLPLTVDDGFHVQFASLPRIHPFRTVRDYENYIARLNAFPAYVEQHIELLREGMTQGYTLARVILDGYDVAIASHVVDDVTKSMFWSPFVSLPSTVPVAEHERLREAGRAAIMNGAVPGYRSFLSFMREEYIPGARETTGASAMPNGDAYYQHTIREYTTLDLTADSIHRIGLAEVARIRAEMQTIIDRVGFRGSFDQFLTFLRTDPRFYAKTPEELLMRASYIAKKMDGKLPALFGRLPRLPYAVAPVPDHLAPKYTGGRYVRAPVGGTEPGYYWVNTYALQNRPLYTLESLTLHEAVPGHHLQVALARELEDLPAFRNYTYISAFGEGWGLYSERLGKEVGFYTDPYSDFGRLTYEMWRACRLVVDTGIHAKGWTRQQAMDYMASNNALSLHEISTEVDRYISWPGQALAYKLGELKIRELRARAEAALGEQFDVRAFHDLVLGAGSVPLTVLEARVHEWIEG
jgi:uncharacterized protein (DUF885 family)